jgi:hypothetical protein
MGDINYLSALLAANPTLYFDELQILLFENRSVDVSLATLSRALHHIALTHKGVAKTAAERNELLCAIWQAEHGCYGYWIFSHISFSLYLLNKETQRDTYLNPCSEFIVNFLDIIYSQMTPFRRQSFSLKLEPLSFRLCLIQ